MNMGVIGGAVGAVIGVLGGIIGTYCSIKNTSGPKEKAFMIKLSVAMWVGITVFLTLLICLPDAYRFVLWLLYGILLPVAIVQGNKRQARIRQEETRP